VSIELPEAYILARQMDEALRGKQVRSYMLKDYEKLLRVGFINKNIGDFDGLVGRTVEGVASRGNTIRVRMDGGMNLLLAPEYGGVILFQADDTDVLKFHLRLDFSDGNVLTARLTSMGVIYAAHDGELGDVYIYRRDFSDRPSPGSPELTFERFRELLARGKQLKPLLVGKDAVVVGLSNSAFQDILYRARLNPRRKASDLRIDEVRALYDAINGLVEDRLRAGGKDEFFDLHGKRGRYTPLMGPKMNGKICPRCGTKVEKISLGGGQIYYSPGCQK
jgi:formamidopyrimidine-DNA glycosylase